MIKQSNRVSTASTSHGNGNGKKKDGRGKVSIFVPKGAPSHLLEKFKKNIVKRDEYLEYNVRGAKAQSLGEIAQVIKWLSTTDPKASFEMLSKDFRVAYGDGKKGLVYVKALLKKFGIKDPKIAQTKQFINGDTVEVIQIWSPVPVSPEA